MKHKLFQECSIPEGNKGPEFRHKACIQFGHAARKCCVVSKNWNSAQLNQTLSPQHVVPLNSANACDACWSSWAGKKLLPCPRPLRPSPLLRRGCHSMVLINLNYCCFNHVQTICSVFKIGQLLFRVLQRLQLGFFFSSSFQEASF